MKTLLFILLFASAALAQSLPTGDYISTVTLGPAYFDGRYPIFVDGTEGGALDLSSSPTGALTGTFESLGLTPVAVTGQVTTRIKGVKLVLRGKTKVGKLTVSVTVNATLAGAVFRGTLTVNGKRHPCIISVDGIAPIQAEYTVALTVDAKGKVLGGGTLTVARTVLPVTTTGKVTKGKVSLSIVGAKTFLRTTTGVVNANGFTATKWSAQGFGSLLTGANLQVSTAP